MVKIHLPHMYMLVECKINTSLHLFYNTPKLFKTFGIISDLLELFSLKSLGPFQFLQGNFLLFSGLDRGASRLFRSFSRILYVSSSLFFVALDVNPNPKYLEIPKEAIWYFLRFQIHCQCNRRVDAGNDELFE